MYDLSQEEKERIRAEVEYREAIRRAFEPKKTRLARLWAGCSHPVIITVLGGLLLAGATAVFQHVSARSQQELLRQQQMLDRKFAVLSSFTQHFEHDMTLLYNIRHMELELNEAPVANEIRPKRALGVLQARFEKMVDEHSKNHRELGVLLEVKVVFANPDVHRIADVLRADVNALLNDPQKSRGNIDELGDKTQKGMIELAEAMAVEINHIR
jgi:hypothetical protein